jgi:hypothetical protein
MDNSRDPEDVLRTIIAKSLTRTYAEIQGTHEAPDLPRRIGDAWMRSLRCSFADLYWREVGQAGVAVFGGKPRHGAPRRNPTGVPSWPRWEYLCDIAVVEMGVTPAFRLRRKSDDGVVPAPVSTVKQAIWLVESEVRRDGTHIADDMGKLKLTKSRHKLFLAPVANPAESEGWLRFLGQVADGVRGDDSELFLGLIPTYSSLFPRDIARWRNEDVEVKLYICDGKGGMPRGLGKPIAVDAR